MSATEQLRDVGCEDVSSGGLIRAHVAHEHQSGFADPEFADNSDTLSPSGWFYVLKELTYATALPNTPEKMEIANRIAGGFQAIARAPTSNGWIHDAFNENRTMETALRARMDKTTVRNLSLNLLTFLTVRIAHYRISVV